MRLCAEANTAGATRKTRNGRTPKASKSLKKPADCSSVPAAAAEMTAYTSTAASTACVGRS